MDTIYKKYYDKMITENQQMINQLMDEGEYAPLYPFVLKSELSEFQKILISLMLNDIRMNGSITWKHQTYADKTNTSRTGIRKQFKILTELKIIIPYENNKAGSKSNKFAISFNAISDFKRGNRRTTPGNGETKHKMVTEEPQHGNGETQHGNGETLHGNRGVHIKKAKETNKQKDKEILNIEPEYNSFVFNVPPKDVPKNEFENWLQEIELN
jgi:hypothetical protein